ncbi:MAG: aminotransferase class I/II-fold pyridoxal phosphate-dependent enzyme [Rhabdochlamydiaceae bacterium]
MSSEKTPFSLPSSSFKSKKLWRLDGPYVLLDQKKMLNFTSQDYLNISQHHELKKEAIRFLLEYGVGHSSSVAHFSYLHCQKIIEKQLASLFCQETAHLFNSFPNVASALLKALITENAVLIVDEEISSSLLKDGYLKKNKILFFAHNNLLDLQHKLQKHKSRDLFVFTQSLFNNTGELGLLKEISELCQKYEAFFIVDDSLSFGLLGKQGRGCTASIKGIDLVFGYFEPLFGTLGSYFCTSLAVKNHLLQVDPVLFDFSLPPCVLGSIQAGLQLLPFLEEAREHLQTSASFLRNKIIHLNFLTRSTSHLIPLSFSSAEEAFMHHENLLKMHIVTGLSDCGKKMMIHLNAQHQSEHIKKLTQALSWTAKLNH